MTARLTLAFLITAGTLGAQRATDQLSWLTGCWERRTPATVVTEHWSSNAGGMLHGVSRTVRRDSVVEWEFVRIHSVGDTLVYEAQPAGQARAEFRAAPPFGPEIVFSNPSHDFPQRVIYRRSGDSLLARIEGTRGRRQRVVEFPYAKVGCDAAPASPSRAAFSVEEAAIAGIHDAFRNGALTCRDLVSAYLARIDAYDRRGPALNSLVVVNPDALATADSLDRRFRQGGPAGPLHCIPMIVKDNFETRDLPTTAGSLSMQGFVPTKDAFQVRRIREAGAIVLAKSNMAEWAFTPYETVSSILPGYTKNPYQLDRVTAGSSGGTAAAVAANLGQSGLGTDTGNSIRGPSAHQALVGIRSTMGLTSRGGVVPLSYAADVAGPMARTVADAVAILQVVAGYDPGDPVTEAVRGREIPEYSRSLMRDGLRGARIGVLRQAYVRPTLDAEVADVFARAVADLRAQGATVIDSVPMPALDSLFGRRRESCNRFRYDLEQWMASTGGRTPVKSLDDIVRSRRFHPSVQARLEFAQRAAAPPDSQPGCAQAAQLRADVRRMLGDAMDGLRLDAVVYPTWSNPPRLIGDLNTPHGDNSQVFSPLTGWPAITVPMGYTRGVLPAGMTIMGRAWSEPTLIRFAYAYEQATLHRRTPAATPPLP